MPSSDRKYVLDTQLFIQGFREPSANEVLQQFHRSFARAKRVVVPSIRAWHQSGDVLSEMARKDGLELPRASKAFANDILLALSSRESGCLRRPPRGPS